MENGKIGGRKGTRAIKISRVMKTCDFAHTRASLHRWDRSSSRFDIPSRYISYQCSKVQFHKASKDDPGRTERRWGTIAMMLPWAVSWAALSPTTIFPAVIRKPGSFSFIYCLGWYLLPPSVCWPPWRFYVPTGRYLVFLSLKCLWTLFHYVESGNRQTDVCEAAMKLAPGLRCLC